MADQAATETPPPKTAVERVLSIFTEVRAGESPSALLLTLNVFLLLTSYYIIKPVRDGLILAMDGGDKYKSYMGAAVAVALLFAVPAYSAYAKRVPRNKLVVGVTLFFVSHIVLFALGTTIPSTTAWMPLVFYLWAGIFSMMVVAQFWAFANDIYTEEQGKRLFALIGIGASLGAVVGSLLSKMLPRRPVTSPEGTVTGYEGYLSVLQLLLLSALLLACCAVITQIVHKRETGKPKVVKKLKDTAVGDSEEMKKALNAAREAAKRRDRGEAFEQKKSGDEGAFGMVFKYRYLLLLALFSLLFTLVNTNGEFIVGKLVKEHVNALVAQNTFETAAEKGVFIKGSFISWYGDFYFYVNVVGVVLQSFVVSRLVKYGGIKLAFFVLPTIALLGAAAMVALPILAIARPSKIAENATDYSVNNTTRNMLWLPTTRQMKYQAKQAVDTFFVRLGDLSSAGLVFVLSALAMDSVRVFALVNLVMIVLWLLLARQILVEKERLTARRESGEIPDD